MPRDGRRWSARAFSSSSSSDVCAHTYVRTLLTAFEATEHPWLLLLIEAMLAEALVEISLVLAKNGSSSSSVWSQSHVVSELAWRRSVCLRCCRSSPLLLLLFARHAYWSAGAAATACASMSVCRSTSISGRNFSRCHTLAIVVVVFKPLKMWAMYEKQKSCFYECEVTSGGSVWFPFRFKNKKKGKTFSGLGRIESHSTIFREEYDAVFVFSSRRGEKNSAAVRIKTPNDSPAGNVKWNSVEGGFVARKKASPSKVVHVALTASVPHHIALLVPIIQGNMWASRQILWKGKKAKNLAWAAN